ncbi:MAG TPA: hypothetical protein DDZ58_06670, partial [Achromobacter sp.]|nr:hypothetical protein [Achromobacter sp.]
MQRSYRTVCPGIQEAPKCDDRFAVDQIHMAGIWMVKDPFQQRAEQRFGVGRQVGAQRFDLLTDGRK